MSKYFYDSNGTVIKSTIDTLTQPQIIRPPVNRISTLGGMATFSVLVDDTNGIRFQWKFNGNNIPGANSDSLILSNLTIANEGAYAVTITKGSYSVTSTPATLSLDLDNDELPDNWEKSNFGSTQQRGCGDPDQDTVSNLDELQDGTSPTSTSSKKLPLIVSTDDKGIFIAKPVQLKYPPIQPIYLAARAIMPNVFMGWTTLEDRIEKIFSTNTAILARATSNQVVRPKFALAAPCLPGMVALWRAESDAKDPIGGHDGQFVNFNNSPSEGAYETGKIGSAFHFKGNNYLRISSATEIKPAQFTLETWVFPEQYSSGDYQVIVDCGASHSFNENEASWRLSLGARLRPSFWSLHKGVNVLRKVEAFDFEVPLQQWTHLAITFDGHYKRIYMNGRQIIWIGNSATAFQLGELSPLSYDPNISYLTIGAKWHDTADDRKPFMGKIDDVSLYNRALSGTEILDIYNSDRLGKDYTKPYIKSSAELPKGAVGLPYFYHFRAALLHPNKLKFVLYSVSSGALPSGLTLSILGDLEGIPQASGVFSFVLRAADSHGHFSEKLFVLQVL